MYGAFILPWKGAWKTLPGGNAALPVPFGRLKLRVPKHLPSPGKPAVAAVAGLGQQRETKARRRAGAPGPAGAAGCRSCRRLPELPPAGEPTARQLPLEPRLGPRLAFGETEAPGGWDCPRRGAGRGLVCRWDFDEPVVRVLFTPCWDAQLSQQRMAVGGPVSGGGSPLLGAGSARARCVPARSPGSTGHTGGGGGGGGGPQR